MILHSFSLDHLIPDPIERGIREGDERRRMKKSRSFFSFWSDSQTDRQSVEHRGVLKAKVVPATNMKLLAVLVLSIICASASAAQLPVVPPLYQLTNYVFAAPYSCNGNYSASALFLSQASSSLNTPDLLYNGACNSQPYFDVTTAGSDFGFIEIYGTDVTLSQLTASDLQNPKNLFSTTAKVSAGHTYGITGSKQGFRYILGVTVNSIQTNGALDITYAVYLYEVDSIVDQSSGFNWDATPQ